MNEYIVNTLVFLFLCVLPRQYGVTTYKLDKQGWLLLIQLENRSLLYRAICGMEQNSHQNIFDLAI